MPYFYFDWTYILVILGAVICMIASARLNGTYNRYARVQSLSGMTGAQAARRILDSAGLYDVEIRHVSGRLTDHYNPGNRTLNLSDTTYNSTSVAAVGVAAHECGHALQHKDAYFPLSFRSTLVPIANIGSSLAWPVIIIGALINGSMGFTIIEIGILLFSLAVLFQLVTLPVEYNASHRALVQLEAQQILLPQEVKHTKKVLSAAALTYVAGAAAAILQLLRLVLLFGGKRDD